MKNKWLITDYEVLSVTNNQQFRFLKTYCSLSGENGYF